MAATELEEVAGFVAKPDSTFSNALLAMRLGPNGFSALLFAAAVLPRSLFALAWTREPVWDGQYYDIGAKSIAAGVGYAGVSGSPWCHYPVGYPALLGVAYRIAGSGQYVGTLLNALLGALVAVVVYRLARRATSELRAQLAGGIVAAYPGLCLYAAVLMTEPIAALGLAAAALVASRWGGSTRGLALSGAVLGLGVLVRPQSLLCAPALALLVPDGPRPRWRAATIATLAAVVVVLPWTLRNCMVMDGCAFVSTNLGWNLAIGAIPRGSGRYETLHGSDGCSEVTGQVEQDRCWLSHGLEWIAEDPARWLGRVDDKLSFTFDHESFPIGYLGEADPATWPLEKRELGRGALSWSHRALLTAAALGVLERPSRRRPSTLLPPLAVALWVWIASTTVGHPFWPLAAFIAVVAAVRRRSLPGPILFAAWTVATVVLTHAVFFGEDRYHMVVTPLLALLAAGVFAPVYVQRDAHPLAALDAFDRRSPLAGI